DRHVRLGGVRDPQQQVLDRRLLLGQLGLDGGQARADLGGTTAELSDLWAIGRRPTFDRLADRFRCRVALGAEAIRLALQLAASGVVSEGRVDERRILALVNGALPDRLTVLAKSLQTDAHAGSLAGADA